MSSVFVSLAMDPDEDEDFNVVGVVDLRASSSTSSWVVRTLEALAVKSFCSRRCSRSCSSCFFFETFLFDCLDSLLWCTPLVLSQLVPFMTGVVSNPLVLLAEGIKSSSSSFLSLLLAALVLGTAAGLTGRELTWLGVVGLEIPGLELALEGIEEEGPRLLLLL